MIQLNKYATMAEANFKIRGGIVGGVATNQPFENLVGLTITFADPVGSCTFTQPSGTERGQLKFPDVKAQIEAALADVVVTTIDNKLGLVRKTHGQNIVLDAADEPARQILGFANAEDIAGQFLNGPSGTNPKYLEFVSEFSGIYIAIEVD
jgi:hypothetical protein